MPDANDHVHPACAIIDAAEAAAGAMLAEAWPAVVAHLAAGRGDLAANVVRLGVEVLWRRLALWRLEADIDPDVWAGVEDAVLDIAIRITERRIGGRPTAATLPDLAAELRSAGSGDTNGS